MQSAASQLASWETFYLIVGSSAGALTGLQFVVIALSAESRGIERSEESLLAFGTPTVVHFCAVLLSAAILSAPWTSLRATGFTLTLCGAAGIAYTIIVIRRAWRPVGYAPVLEDWLWHAVLPAIAYLSLVVAAWDLPDHPSGALFGLGAVALLLIFIGIHNAWDAAAYMAFGGHGTEAVGLPPAPLPPPEAAPENPSGRSSEMG